jgi:hypothetical protein
MSAEAEYETEIKRRNFTRAARLAEDAGLDDELVSAAREQAFMQSLGEWFNFRSAETLAREWGFTREKVDELCAQIVKRFDEREKRDEREFKVFDINRMDHTSAARLVTQFRDRFR